MVFSSSVFLFAFLPLFLAVYYLTPGRWRSVPIIVGSFVFYAYWRVDFAALFMAITLWNYCVYKRMAAGHSRRWMQIGVAGNLAALGFFKYFNFGVDSLNALLSAAGGSTVSALPIILPIGISFYIFQAISFLIDMHRKDAPAPRGLLDFAAFMSLFPQLIAGPILRYKDMADQLRNRTHDFDRFSEGAYRFMTGFAQKVLIADNIAPLADMAFSLEEPTMAEAWLGALAYTLQLYFDFMGYTSMAIGLGLMLGFRFAENFNHPYLARSIGDFWRRWHMSLSIWLRDYLYIPLGGNRGGRTQTTRNIMITFLLGGIWHGANWTFVLWGAWHGAILSVERALGIKKIGWLLTFLAVMVGWVMFRADTAAQAFIYYQGMIGLNGFSIGDEASWRITRQSLLFTGIGAVLLYIHSRWLEFRTPIDGSPAMKSTGYRKPVVAVCVCGAFILAVTKVAASAYTPFLYFQF